MFYHRIALQKGAADPADPNEIHAPDNFGFIWGGHCLVGTLHRCKLTLEFNYFVF